MASGDSKDGQKATKKAKKEDAKNAVAAPLSQPVMNCIKSKSPEKTAVAAEKRQEMERVEERKECGVTYQVPVHLTGTKQSTGTAPADDDASSDSDDDSEDSSKASDAEATDIDGSVWSEMDPAVAERAAADFGKLSLNVFGKPGEPSATVEGLAEEKLAPLEKKTSDCCRRC